MSAKDLQIVQNWLMKITFYWIHDSKASIADDASKQAGKGGQVEHAGRHAKSKIEILQ